MSEAEILCSYCKEPILYNEQSGKWESEEWLAVCFREGVVKEGSPHVPPFEPKKSDKPIPSPVPSTWVTAWMNPRPAQSP